MWPSYVINLARNTGRMENSARQLAAHGIEFERIDAVDGWSLSDPEIDSVYDKAANRRRARYDLIRPEIGCYLSHIEAWLRIAGGGGGRTPEDSSSRTTSSHGTGSSTC